MIVRRDTKISLLIKHLTTMRILHLYIKLFLYMVYISEAICWLDAVRTFSVKSSTKKERRNSSTIKDNTVKTFGCRRDRHCNPSQFCHRYERSCVACKTEGQMCRRSKMCCRGMECAAGKCRAKIQLGLVNSLCSKDRECDYGLCCARENGQSVCKPLLKVGQSCGIPEGGSHYFWSHQCPCEYGLKCKEISSIKTEKVEEFKEIIESWNDGVNWKCVKPLHVKIS